MRFVLPPVFTLTLFLTACGGSGGQPDPAAEAAPDTLHIVPMDTIGVDVGDSNYVFGMMLAAEVDRGGRLLALDPQLCRLSAFDGDGDFLGFAGGRGSGPGELQLPMDFAVLGDGSVVVNDLQSGRLTFYDPALEYRSSLEGFFPTPPMFLTGFHDSHFVASDISVDLEGERPAVYSRAGIWSPDSTGPERVLTSIQQPATMEPDPEDPVEELTVAASDSLVFVGYQSVDRFLVEVYDADGNLLRAVERPWERMEKTPREMEGGGMSISVSRDGEGGSTTEARATEDVVPWRNAIEQVAADSRGRLWIELGSRPFRPTFEVYDPRSGDLLFVAVADSSLADGRISVSPGGFVHFNPNPEDYPRLIRLELAE
ncbi:MAG: hypothetical protein R6U36_09030 [Candidatus Fermentibacteraceae bacterium]